MLRLVKILNANNQYEVAKLKYNTSATIKPGCALSCSSGVLLSATNTATPDYVALSSNDDQSVKTIDAILVTEDMIFKVEYTGTTTPYVGMPVGLATGKYKMDSVTQNSSGKGVIVELDDDKKLVYVRFRR